MTSAVPGATRAAVLRYRVHAQQLDAGPAPSADPLAPTVLDPTVLDAGVQDTGPDGALWALALRGAEVRAGELPDALALAWTLRGAPHAYRRDELEAVEAAVRPWSARDAAQRVFDAARPLRAAGIDPRDALATAARTMRDVVTTPMPKGAVSTALTSRLPEPYLRWCRTCGATHVYEQTFRLAALHGGLELVPGTSPPVLRRVAGWPPDAVGRTDPPAPGGRHDVVRTALHLLGPSTPRLVAAYLDAPVSDVTARWPQDVHAVDVAGEPRSVLTADADALAAAHDRAPTPVRLLGPYDLFLQARDRELLVPDAPRRAALWPALGRPGAVLRDGEVVGTWRPRARGARLALEVDPWTTWDAATRGAVATEHERLAEFRGKRPA
ncbi:winged helix DNA-binding domain-containing protein [Cellulomonas xiejunii]|uniref:Winged helix DNA-binding domain-containing protein n=1 Tax=Cellulomonas xiejunii TaxID=2968083 RepID=A0ABY5KU76_9CELL|nr:winged helix DNA-binding domain-containing protein [Cellulomonas xiejunii]MCC2321994.1 winged helix DNA-binding domain-containing protein [Cellulomonas xiejunii]UUI73290.1 winged helix DNA-binding domain-containing protein [Cellulomonas xiejunii]